MKKSLVKELVQRALKAYNTDILIPELNKKANASHGTHVTYGGNGSATTVSRSDHTHNYVPTGNIASGSGTFNSISGRTISIGKTMSSNTYKVSVTPTANPDGSLGEVWIESKTTTSFVVKCSGSTTTCTFDWMITL